MTLSSSSKGDASGNSAYIGNNIGNILYGMAILLYFNTIHLILSKGKTRRKSSIFYALFSSVMLFLTTIWVAAQARFGQEIWLLSPNFPGGPNAYWREHISDWYMDWATTSIFLLQLITDALMIYRCRIIWNNYRAIVIPIILWLATLGLGILMDWTSSTPGGDFFTGTAAHVGLAYWTVAVFLNTILTCTICYRLVRHGLDVREHLGREYASFYFALTTTIVESVFPSTISGIAFLVSFGIGSPTSVAFTSVYVLTMCISSQLLILRVIAGRSWKNDTSSLQNSTIQFVARSQLDPQGPKDTRASAPLQMLSNVYFPETYHDV